jgi:signal transduction histidine kinase
MRTAERARRLAVDVALAVVFVAAVAAERVNEPTRSGPETVVSVALTLTMAGGLVARRRYPMAAYLTGTVALCVEAFLPVASPISPYANLLGVYSLGLYASRALVRWGPLLIVVATGIYFLGTSRATGTVPLDGIGVLIVWLATWTVGYQTARRRDEQEIARQAVRQQVVAEEQTRMARELHDLVGHTVNLMVVQAGAGRLMLDTDPATTRALLAEMEETGRAALTDLDQILGALRCDQAPLGLARLPELVHRLTGSGVEVTLNVEPDLRLPRPLDLFAYRIVQEALTNTIKHAAPCSATVDVRRAGGDVVIEVSDTGSRRSVRQRPGRGLLGIAERVSVCGGVLTHGARDKGGFALRAVLPAPLPTGLPVQEAALPAAEAERAQS